MNESTTQSQETIAGSEQEDGPSPTLDDFEACLGEIANHLGQGIRVGTVKNPRFDRVEGELVVSALSPDDDRTGGLRVSGNLKSSKRMTIKPFFAEVFHEVQRYGDENLKIGVSVMTRPPENVARDIERRLLSGARDRYRTLLRRKQKREHRKERRRKLCEKIEEATGLEFQTHGSTSATIRAKREAPLGEQTADDDLKRPGHALSLRVTAKKPDRFELEIEEISASEAIALLEMLAETVDADHPFFDD